MKRLLLRSPSFSRDLRRWLKRRPETATAIQTALDNISEDSANPILRVHPLKGPLVGCLACSAGYDVRIVFEYAKHAGAEAVRLLALGTHEEVY